MWRTDIKAMVLFPLGVGVICLLTVAVPVKGLGYDGARTPPPNGNASIQTFIVHENQTLRIIGQRIKETYAMALFKDTMKIMALRNSNESVYVNTSREKDLQKNKEHFEMQMINDSSYQVLIVIKCVAFVQGNYSVHYYLNGKRPPEDPEPLTFSLVSPTEVINSTTQGTDTGMSAPGIPPTPKKEQISVATVTTYSTKFTQPASNTGLQARKARQLPLEIVVGAVILVAMVMWL